MKTIESKALTLAPPLTPARAQPPTVIAIRLRVAEACNWLRDGAPGKALEVLETLQDSLKGNHEH